MKIPRIPQINGKVGLRAAEDRRRQAAGPRPQKWQKGDRKGQKTEASKTPSNLAKKAKKTFFSQKLQKHKKTKIQRCLKCQKTNCLKVKKGWANNRGLYLWQKIWFFISNTWKCCSEMQKAASVASALVLFFPLSVLIFGLYTRKTG